MKVIKSTRSVFFDVDDTLALWEGSSYSGHQRHIEMMAKFKERGHTVVVWSAGGAEWAVSVCEELGIEDLVDYVMDKPSWYVDDLPSSVWMKNPIYLHPTDPSKDQEGR